MNDKALSISFSPPLIWNDMNILFCTPLHQILTFRFQNFSVSRLMPIFFRVSVSENLVSIKKSQFRFRRICSLKKVSVSENLVLKKSIGFGKFGIVKKSHFWAKFWSCNSVHYIALYNLWKVTFILVASFLSIGYWLDLVVFSGLDISWLLSEV